MKQSIKWFMTMSAVVLGIMPLKAEAMEYSVATEQINWVHRSVDNVRASIATQGGEYYVVEWGDTLGTIAEALSVPLSTLKQLNNIQDEHFILVGTVIYYNTTQQTISVIDELGEVDTVSVIDGTPIEEEVPKEVVRVAQVNALTIAETMETSNDVANVNTDNTVVVEMTEVVDNTESTVISSIDDVEATTSTDVTNAYQPIQSAAKEWIAQKESGGDYNVVNPTGKYIGRYQLTAEYLNGDYSIENQERVADEYVLKRYGSWEEAKVFWEANGWY